MTSSHASTTIAICTGDVCVRSNSTIQIGKLCIGAVGQCQKLTAVTKKIGLQQTTVEIRTVSIKFDDRRIVVVIYVDVVIVVGVLIVVVMLHLHGSTTATADVATVVGVGTVKQKSIGTLNRCVGTVDYFRLKREIIDAADTDNAHVTDVTTWNVNVVVFEVLLLLLLV